MAGAACGGGVTDFGASDLGAVCTAGVACGCGVTGFGASDLGAVCMAGAACGGGVTDFGASDLGAVCTAGVACGGGVAGFGASALGAVCDSAVLFVSDVPPVPGFCGFAFTTTSPGIVLGTGWLPVIRVPSARWGILVITGAADAPYGAHPRINDASNPAVTVFAMILCISL